MINELNDNVSVVEISMPKMIVVSSRVISFDVRRDNKFVKEHQNPETLSQLTK